MNQTMPVAARWWLGAALLVALLASGCPFDGAALEDRQCTENSDCTGVYNTCLEGYCTFVEVPDIEEIEEEPDMVEEDIEPDPLSFCNDRDGDNYARESDDPRCPMMRELDSCDAFAMRNPSVPETCDGLDNDCDGIIDNKLDENPAEQEARLCPRQEGLCAGAARDCVNGRYEADCGDDDYQEVFPEGTTYVPDEAFCAQPQSGARLDNKSRCRAGAVDGIDGLEDAELILCDGFDNDCDGVVDEEEELRVPCYDEATGDLSGEATLNVQTMICVAGHRVCNAGSYGAECVGQVLPSTDLCNDAGLDEDCDGMPNDGCACTFPSSAACYSGPQGTAGRGICREGTMACQANGTFGACVGDTTPGIESCANLNSDDDCDGVMDNINGVAYNSPCDTGLPGVCGGPGSGIMTCVNGQFICRQEVPPARETCQDRFTDNDCDGNATDLDYDPEDPDSATLMALNGDIALGASCNTGALGVCEAGLWSCGNGVTYAFCNPTNFPLGNDVGGNNMPQICNGLDDDCDGDIDEDTDFTESPNCGDCGTTCGANQDCCPPRAAAPDEEYACTTISQNNNTQGDPNNCGGCGFESAVFRCGVGQTCCGTGCVNLATDDNNCGACGNACGDGMQCCDSQCVALNSPTNCGGCATANADFNCMANGFMCCADGDSFSCLDVAMCP